MKNVEFSEIKDKQFFWFYFLCSFPKAYDPDEDSMLADFIQEHYCSKESFQWWNSFTQYYDGVFDEYDGYVEDPSTIVIPVGENEYSIQFHPGDTEYYLNGEKIGSTGPSYVVSKIKYSDFTEIVTTVNDPLKAFLLLPLVYIEESEIEPAREYVMQVLKMLPVLPEHYETILKTLIVGMK